MISSISLYSAPQTGGSLVSKAISTVEKNSSTPLKMGVSSTQNNGTLTISTLGSQLAASASSAEKINKTLTHSELANKAKTALNQIQGDDYFANKVKHDSEVPKTNDLELLSRAKQATAYVNNAAKGGNSEKNPFAGLSREQLAIIVYDDSGTYTVNERRAASYEADLQEEAWRVKVTTQAINEYNSTGKLTNFFSSVLEHFKELPAIEQAQYPKDYASDLESKISRDFNYRTHQAEGKSEDPVGLIEMLFEQNPKQPNEILEKKNTTDSSTARSNP